MYTTKNMNNAYRHAVENKSPDLHKAPRLLLLKLSVVKDEYFVLPQVSHTDQYICITQGK